MTQASRLDSIQAGVLDRMERAEKLVRAAVIGAAMLEAGLFAIALYLVDWGDRVQTLMFIFAVLSYTIIALGLLALGAHVTKTGARILAAMDTSA